MPSSRDEMIRVAHQVIVSGNQDTQQIPAKQTCPHVFMYQDRSISR